MAASAFIIGHQRMWNRDSRRPGLYEYDHNVALGDMAMRGAPNSMIAIATPEPPAGVSSAVGNAENILARIEKAKYNRVRVAIELHHNEGVGAYGLILFGSEQGRHFAERLRSAVLPVMPWCLPAHKGGDPIIIDRHGDETGWGYKAAIAESPYVCLIFEAAFMSSPEHDQYFEQAALRQALADKLRETLAGFALEV
jgi:hypothetical protein